MRAAIFMSAEEREGRVKIERGRNSKDGKGKMALNAAELEKQIQDKPLKMHDLHMGRFKTGNNQCNSWLATLKAFREIF